MKVSTALAGLGALLVLIAVTVYGLKADARARVAIADSHASRTATATALAKFEQGQKYADSVHAAGVAKLAAASRLRARVDTLRVTFEETATAAPDTCAPVIAAARDALAASRAENDELLGSIGAMSFAYETLRAHSNVLADSARRLVVTTERLEKVIAGRKWYQPEIRVTAGIGPRGADVVIGPSWRVF
jgi:hypothetical protein